MISCETAVQSVVDAIEDASKRSKRGPGKYRMAAIQEAAEYRSIYKALMHHITQKEYADVVAPAILQEMLDVIRARKLLSEAEIGALYERGKRRAEVRQEAAKREIERVYGQFQTISNRTKADPTADAAIEKLTKRGTV